jgi:rare lipoprotein A
MGMRLSTLHGLAWIALLVSGCATLGGSGETQRASRAEIGSASYYAHRFQGRRTASGERYDEDALTAAHRTLPFGTRVQVTNLDNDHTVVVRINDRGPHRKGRVLDVSRRAARELGFIGDGTTRVRLEVLEETAADR